MPTGPHTCLPANEPSGQSAARSRGIPQRASWHSICLPVSLQHQVEAFSGRSHGSREACRPTAVPAGTAEGNFSPKRLGAAGHLHQRSPPPRVDRANVHWTHLAPQRVGVPPNGTTQCVTTVGIAPSTQRIIRGRRPRADGLPGASPVERTESATARGLRPRRTWADASAAMGSTAEYAKPPPARVLGLPAAVRSREETRCHPTSTMSWPLLGRACSTTVPTSLPAILGRDSSILPTRCRAR